MNTLTDLSIEQDSIFVSFDGESFCSLMVYVHSPAYRPTVSRHSVRGVWRNNGNVYVSCRRIYSKRTRSGPIDVMDKVYVINLCEYLQTHIITLDNAKELDLCILGTCGENFLFDDPNVREYTWKGYFTYSVMA